MEKSVLIVDDSNTNNVLINNLLKDEGINSSFAYSGDEAFQFMEENKPALILLDVMMPKVDGFEVFEKIKSNPHTKDIPVIFITAKTDTETKTKALRSGAIDFIQKPINIQRLVELVRTQLSI